MDRSTARIAFTALTIATIVVLGGCMDASLSQSGNAPASISIQDAPSTLGDIDLTISGPGMSDIQETVDRNTDAVVIEVPVGPDREFEATGFLNSDTTAFYEGLSTSGVGPGGAQVGLPMGLRSKIVIPDDGFSTQRIVRLDSVQDGADGWQTNGVGVAYDVDFDEFGRMYLAMQENTPGALLRLDTFGQATPEQLAPTLQFLISVAVDRSNQRVYVLESFSTNVHELRYDGTIEGLVDLSALPSSEDIGGIAVDDDGALFVVQEDYVSKVDPDTGSILSSFRYAEYGFGPGQTNDFAVDISFQNQSVYLLLEETEALSSIVRLDAGLTGIVEQYGSSANDPADDPGEFDTPRRFVATLNRKITVADSGADQVVSLDDLDGDGWTTFGSSGSGIGQFDFRFFDLPAPGS